MRRLFLSRNIEGATDAGRRSRAHSWCSCMEWRRGGRGSWLGRFGEPSPSRCIGLRTLVHLHILIVALAVS
jgi:hypothetical protein